MLGQTMLVHQSSERQCGVRDTHHAAVGASLGDIWMYPLTIAFAADLVLSSALRLFISKRKMRRNPDLCLIHPPSLPQGLLPCPSGCPQRAEPYPMASSSSTSKAEHMKSSPSNQIVCNLCIHFKALFPFCRVSGGMEEAFKAQIWF